MLVDLDPVNWVAERKRVSYLGVNRLGHVFTQGLVSTSAAAWSFRSASVSLSHWPSVARRWTKSIGAIVPWPLLLLLQPGPCGTLWASSVRPGLPVLSTRTSLQLYEVGSFVVRPVCCSTMPLTCTEHYSQNSVACRLSTLCRPALHRKLSTFANRKARKTITQSEAHGQCRTFPQFALKQCLCLCWKKATAATTTTFAPCCKHHQLILFGDSL